jgi:TonB-linked SusC/RagA family outer membrane protein
MEAKKLKTRTAAPLSGMLLMLLLNGEASANNDYRYKMNPAANLTTHGFANWLQDKKLSGKVKDAAGEPISGATVFFKSDPKKVYQTDANGVFSVPFTKDGDVLVITSIGTKSQELVISGEQLFMDIFMEAKAADLDEVVVVGYGTQLKRKVTAAVGKVEGKSLESLPINSLGDGLKGKVAGMNVYTTDQQPGENPSFRIRGGSSINQTNAPIVVVDGVVRDLSGINPNDIESIEVLKDAASAAIYGARASNGIVMVTTKRGVSKKPQILFESSAAHQSPAQLFDLMNAEDYLRYMRPAIAEGKYPQRNFQNGFSTSSANTDASMWSTRYLQPGETVPAGWKSMPDPLDPAKILVFEDNDFQKRFFDNSTWTNHYVGINGASDVVKYNASAGYTNDGGIGIGTSYERFTMRGNMDIKITDRLNFMTSYDYAHTELEDYPGNKRNSVQRGLSTPFTHRLYNVATGLPEKGYNGSTPTPDWYEYYYDRSQTTKRNTISARLNYQLNKKLSFTGMLTNFNRHTRGYNFQKANEYVGLRETNESFSELNRLNLQAFANYKNKWGNHNFEAVIGTEYMKDRNNAFAASVTGAASDKVPTLTAGAIPGMPTSGRTSEVLISYFTRLNYDYKDRYLLSFTMRADGSSKFLGDNVWGYFPAASAGYIISEEDWWKNSDFSNVVNSFKLRTSYGLTGNNSIALFDAQGNYSTSGRYNGASAIITSTMPNPTLRWETTQQLDIGFDAGLFNNRINFGVDYFNKITNDLLFNQPLPNTSGYSTVMMNIGKVKYYGLEFHISSTNIATKNFTWTTNFNYGYVMNQVLKLPENGRDKNRIGGVALADGTAFGGIAEGERLFRIYGYVVDRILETPAQAAGAMYDAQSNGFSNTDGLSITGRKNVGDYEWVNRPGSSLRNGEDQINAEDQFLLGYTMPHTTGGITNNFQYKNWTLNVAMDFALGHTVQNYLQERYFMGTFNYNYNLTNEVKKAWTQPGDNTPYAKFTANDADDGSRNYSRVSNIFSEKGDYLCLRDVTLAYQLPQAFLAKYKIKNVVAYVSGQNLHYFTKVTGVAPEMGTGSTYDTDYNPYPASRRVALGLKVTL